MTKPKILLIRPGALGDVCLTIPLARALQAHADVVWLLRRHYVPLVQRFPEVTVVLLPSDLDRREVPDLRRQRFDAVLDLSHWPEVARLVHELDTVPLRAITHDPAQDQRLGVNRAGLDLYGPYNCRVAVDPECHQTERWRTLVRAALGIDLHWPAPPVPCLTPGQRLRLFVHPHAGKPSKLWPIGEYVRVLTTLAQRHPIECWINSGNRPEWLRALGLWLRLRLAGVRAAVVPRDRSYRRLTRCLPTFDLALGSDSGPMHLASLLGVPTVVLFGPYPAFEFQPLWHTRPVSPATTGAPAVTIQSHAVTAALEETIHGLAHRSAA